MKRKMFDDLIERRWGSLINPLMTTDPEPDEFNDFDEYDDDDEEARVVPDMKTRLM